MNRTMQNSNNQNRFSSSPSFKFPWFLARSKTDKESRKTKNNISISGEVSSLIDPVIDNIDKQFWISSKFPSF